MPHYRLYYLDHGDSIVGRVDFDAPDDPSALEKAKELCAQARMGCELWEGGRKVHTQPVAGH